jgi:phosphomannomutase
LAKADRTDGVRMELEGGDTLHFRASGNAPELRCYAESVTADQAASLLQWGLAKAEAAIIGLGQTN